MFDCIGARIKELRIFYHMTRDEFAEKVDLSGSYIGLVERGARTLSLPKLIEVCNALNSSLDYIINGVGKKTADSFGPELQIGGEDTDPAGGDPDKARKNEFLREVYSVVALHSMSDRTYRFYIEVLKRLAEMTRKGDI